VPVIHEIAEFTIAEGREPEFEDTMMIARRVIARAPGFVSIEYWRGVERPQVYTLIIKWRSVEAHTEGFRQSALYSEWSALVRPFFAAPPEVAHAVPRINPFHG
jgi:heme-degrading monooxygenase HmoA